MRERSVIAEPCFATIIIIFFIIIIIIIIIWSKIDKTKAVMLKQTFGVAVCTSQMHKQ